MPNLVEMKVIFLMWFIRKKQMFKSLFFSPVLVILFIEKIKMNKNPKLDDFESADFSKIF